MAISTQGFRLSNLPSYSAPDPNLVAFNPSAVTGGIGQSFQLASMLEQVKAQRQKKALMDAIMQSQIEAENAKNNQITQLAGPETQNKLKALDVSNLKFNAEMPNIAPAGLLEGKRISAATNMVQPLSEAEIAQANASKAASESALNLNALTENTSAAKMNALQKDLEDADQLRESRIGRAVAENAYAKTKNTSEEASFEADQKLKDEKLKAETDFLKAHAKYFEMGGAPRADKDPATQIRALGLAAKGIEDEYQLPAYESATYDANGKLKTNLIFPNPKQDKSKEDALAKVRLLRKAQDVLLRKWVDSSVQEAGVSTQASAQAPAAGGPQVGSVLNGYRFKGGDPKVQSNWEKLSPIK